MISGDQAGRRYLDALFKTNPAEYREIQKLLTEAKHGGRKK